MYPSSLGWSNVLCKYQGLSSYNFQIILYFSEDGFCVKNSVDPDEMLHLAVFQWCSQNAEKVTHIKGKLLYQALILYNYIFFQNGNFS